MVGNAILSFLAPRQLAECKLICFPETLICIVVTWFFHMESLKVHIWMTVFIASLLGLVVFMVVSVDNPYRGKISVSPAPFERVHGQMTKSGM